MSSGEEVRVYSQGLLRHDIISHGMMRLECDYWGFRGEYKERRDDTGTSPTWQLEPGLSSLTAFSAFLQPCLV